MSYLKIEVYKTQKEAEKQATYLEKHDFVTIVKNYTDVSWDSQTPTSSKTAYQDSGEDVWVVTATKE
jgi:hypothetical protein